ncbi:metallophosphoesterase [Hydrogenophaga sp.]|uniref:metallophosphoesterase n=1 Tax=Hydrogenophaga sp. TaxID=1904254 RepID=UPI002715A4BA|nr:metallophosphoesterase [Hydrogenophaga sp.]MDO8906234.1 metallophosphoesterase [Hydrogenophaga sp.]
MKLQLLSDLHLEANREFQAEPAAGANLLVLAGDIGSYQARHDGSVMDEPDWGLQRFSPLPRYAGWPVPVLFVPGNHEYDALDVDEAHTQLRQTCDRLGITWLERETLEIEGVRWIGTTLWSDFDALGDLNLQRPPADGSRANSGGKAMRRTSDPLTHRHQQREKAFRAANFYLSKVASHRHGRLFDAEAMRALGLECQDWLHAALQRPFEGPTVVVTHFAPTLHSADPRYGLRPGTAGFCNGLDDWLSLADLWLHGHLHCPQDRQVGRCRIVANPLGYADKDEQKGFQMQQLIEVPRIRRTGTDFAPAQSAGAPAPYTGSHSTCSGDTP